MLNEFGDAAHTQPAHHLRRNFVADEISENSGVTGVYLNRVGNGTRNFVSRRSFAQEFDVFGPRQSDERAHSGFGAGIEKPTWRAVINADDVESGCANLGKIARGLIWCSEIVPERIRFEWAIGDTFNEKFTLTFEEKFCDGADWIRRRNAHSGGFLDHAEEVRKNFEL